MDFSQWLFRYESKGDHHSSKLGLYIASTSVEMESLFPDTSPKSFCSGLTLLWPSWVPTTPTQNQEDRMIDQSRVLCPPWKLEKLMVKSIPSTSMGWVWLSKENWGGVLKQRNGNGGLGTQHISCSGHLGLCYLQSYTLYFERDFELFWGSRAKAKLETFWGCFPDGLPRETGIKQRNFLHHF